MEILTTPSAATAARGSTAGAAFASSSYNKSLMAARALQGNGINNEVSIEGLQKGDVFKGEITNITGRDVTVSLGNGQVLHALLMENVAINIGNSLYFEVKENNGKTIIIHPLTDEKFSPQNQTIEKSLQSAGLQLNEKNMAVVKELMDASMPIDRNSVMKILQQSVNFPDASVKTLVEMTKCNLTITAENITQFEQYMAGEHQLNQQLDAMISDVTGWMEQLGGDDAFAGDIVRMNYAFVSTFVDDASAATAPDLSLAQAFAMDETEVAAFLQSDAALETDENGQVIVDELGNRYPQGSLLKNEAGQLVTDEAGQLQFTPEYAEHLTRQQKEDIAQGRFYSEERMAQPEMTNEIQAGFARRLEEFGMSKEQIAQVLRPDHTAAQLLKNIQQFVEQNDLLSDTSMKQFFSSREYGVLLESVMENQWKLKPQQLNSSEQIEQLYNRIEKQTKQLLSTADSFSSFGEQMRQHGENLQENLHFMQMLNDKYTYAQIPLQLSRQDTNSELYVYTSKKALEKEKKDISVLLHLDMEHLGSTDVHVQLNGTVVTARFYMEDNRASHTVQSHIEQLREQLAAIGFSLQSEVVRRTDKKKQVENFAEDFLAKDLPASQQVKRYNFDMRA